MTTKAGERNDFDHEFWGKTTWKTMFIFALSYPWSNPDQATRLHFSTFFTSLQGVIPCERCRKGYESFLVSNPLEPRLSSKIELLKWLICLYNNKRPAESRVNNLRDLTKKVVKPDKTVDEIIRQIKKSYPDLSFA